MFSKFCFGNFFVHFVFDFFLLIDRYSVVPGPFVKDYTFAIELPWSCFWMLFYLICMGFFLDSIPWVYYVYTYVDLFLFLLLNTKSVLLIWKHFFLYFGKFLIIISFNVTTLLFPMLSIFGNLFLMLGPLKSVFNIS